MKKPDQTKFLRAELVNKITLQLVRASKRLGVPIDDLSNEVTAYAKFKTNKK